MERHRRPERVLTCGLCSSVFDLAHVYTWTHHGRPAVLHPNYEAELARLREGRHTVLLPVGARVRVTVEGEHHGTVGRVAKRGRTSYHLRAGRTPAAGAVRLGRARRDLRRPRSLTTTSDAVSRRGEPNHRGSPDPWPSTFPGEAESRSGLGLASRDRRRAGWHPLRCSRDLAGRACGQQRPQRAIKRSTRP